MSKIDFCIKLLDTLPQFSFKNDSIMDFFGKWWFVYKGEELMTIKGRKKLYTGERKRKRKNWVGEKPKKAIFNHK